MLKIITLRPTGSFHIGQDIGVERQKVYAYIPSDTLFGALMVIWAQQGKAGEMLRLFADHPPFTLSSAFPCLMAKDDPWRVVVRLLPLPLVKLPDDNVMPPKDKKRIRWVSEGVFERLCAAQPLNDETTAENFAQSKAVWLLKQEREKIKQAWGREVDMVKWWATYVVPHVTVDRVTNASSLFHTGRVMLADGVGLWFALRSEGIPMPSFESALDALADSGLGGLRSTGHGAFVWKWDPHPGLSPQAGEGAGGSSGYAVTLARYAPKDADEIAHSLKPRGTSYQLVNVVGWCHDDVLHPWRRKRVRLVMEGSVIAYAGEHAGQLVDVKPTGAPQAKFYERGVYRYGYAFPIGVRKEALREVPHE